MVRIKEMVITKALILFLSFFLAVGLTAPYAFSDVSAVQNLSVGASSSSQVLPDSGNVTVNFKDVDITTVLHYLSEVSGIDIVPSPEVTGTVTMRLRDKPWAVALDVVTRNRGYVYSIDDEKGIIRVMPKAKLEDEEPISEVIFLNYITPGQESLMTIAERKNSIEKTSLQDYYEAKGLFGAIKQILSKNETVTYLKNSNALVVTAIPARIQKVKKLIAKIDKKTPQIMLETKIIEVSLDKNDQFGIDWNMVIEASGSRRPTTFPFTNAGLFPMLPGGAQRNFLPVNSGGDFNDTAFPQIDVTSLFDPTALATSGAMFAYGTLDFSQFSAVLRLIDEMDNTNIISSPRVTTLNNQLATIKVTNNFYLQKSIDSTDTARTITVEFETKARETGVILEVIPHVNEKNEITVDLHPSVSTVPTFEELEVSGAQNTVAMTFNSREAETQVMVNDGETIFIGGLISETTTAQEHKVPILGDLFGWIPVVGSAVKYNQDNVDKTEIVFFVTVHLIGDVADTINKSGSDNVYDKYCTGDNYHSNDKPVVKTGVLTSNSDTAEIPVDPFIVETKKKAFWDFRKKNDSN